jgi:hypothetical protein
MKKINRTIVFGMFAFTSSIVILEARAANVSVPTPEPSINKIAIDLRNCDLSRNIYMKWGREKKGSCSGKGSEDAGKTIYGTGSDGDTILKLSVKPNRGDNCVRFKVRSGVKVKYVGGRSDVIDLTTTDGSIKNVRFCEGTSSSGTIFHVVITSLKQPMGAVDIISETAIDFDS